MTYIITNSSGSKTYTINDGTLDTTDLDINLPGRGYVSYGSALNTNFLKLLENFSNSSAPAMPVTGQLWYDSLNGLLKVYNGASFTAVQTVINTSDITLGSLRLYNNSLTGQTNNANVNIIPNGTGYTVVNNLGIVGTSTGKLLYTAANGSIQSTTMSYTTSGDTLTVTSINGTNFAGTSGSFNTAIVSGNTSTGNLTASTAVYSPAYFYSNGVAFTTSGGSSYSNTTVAAYLAAGINSTIIGINANVSSANSVIAGQTTSINTINANILAANSVIATKTTYANSNVAAYLSTYAGTIYGNISGNLNVTSLNVSGTANANAFTATYGGQITGYLTGPIGANTANSGSFTTLTSSAQTNLANTAVSSLYISNGIFWANGTASIQVYANLNTVVSANLLPQANNSYNIGSATAYWGNVYANSIITNGNVKSSSYFVGNGYYLTGLSASSTLAANTVKAISGSYTITTSDSQTTLEAADGTTITLGTLSSAVKVDIVQTGTGTVTITGSNLNSRVGTGTVYLSAQYAGCTVYNNSGGTLANWVAVGDISSS